MILTDDNCEFLDKLEWSFVEFTFNTNNIDLFFDIFNGNTLNLVPHDNGSPAYVTGGLANYNSFIQGLFSRPKIIRRIVITANKDEYLQQPLNILHEDANGIQYIKPKLTSNYFYANQFQSQVNVDFEPYEFIIDNSSFISQYHFTTFSSVKFLIYYKEINRAELLSRRSENLMEYAEKYFGKKSPTASEPSLESDTGIFITPMQLVQINNK